MKIDRNLIVKVIIDQKNELSTFQAASNIIERESYRKFLPFVNSPQIKVITGVRRCGKSVFSAQLLNGKKYAYINFDDEKLINLSSDDLNDILEVLYEVYGDFKDILLDEIQNIKGWELFVNRLQRQGFNITVTGSNANLLTRELSTHLTGRHISLKLFPFSFAEFLKYHNSEYDIKLLSTKETAILKGKLQEYINIGGFPQVVQDPNNSRSYLQSLYSDIIYKDIVLRYKLRLPQILKEISSNLISNPASYVSYNKIKNIFSLRSVQTASNYISYLEEPFLIFLLPRFSYKAKERSVAVKKVYAIDTGMINAAGVSYTENIGRLYENIVFLELLRRGSELSYWQDMKGEVDFVSGNELIQVCYSLNYDTKKREVKSLLNAGMGKKYLIITSDYEADERIEGKLIRFMPLWKWLLTKEP